MTISLDYDDTFTQDPGLWAAFIQAATQRGHVVLLTTNRSPAFGREVHRALHGLPVAEVIFAGRLPKRVAAARRGHRVDVWVDDLPHTVELGR